MTRDEFIRNRMRDEMAMYRWLFRVSAAAVVGAAALAVAMLVTGGLLQALSVLSIGLTLLMYGVSARSQAASFQDALDEIGDATDLAENVAFSLDTQNMILVVLMPAKQLQGMFIAYAVTTVMLLAGAITMFVLIEDRELVFDLLGALLAAGGILMLILSVKTFRSWQGAKQLNLR